METKSTADQKVHRTYEIYKFVRFGCVETKGHKFVKKGVEFVCEGVILSWEEIPLMPNRARAVKVFIRVSTPKFGLQILLFSHSPPRTRAEKKALEFFAKCKVGWLNPKIKNFQRD